MKNQSDLYIFVLTGTPAGTPAGTPTAYRLRTGVAERDKSKVLGFRSYGEVINKSIWVRILQIPVGKITKKILNPKC